MIEWGIIRNLGEVLDWSDSLSPLGCVLLIPLGVAVVLIWWTFLYVVMLCVTFVGTLLMWGLFLLCRGKTWEDYKRVPGSVIEELSRRDTSYSSGP